MSMSVVVPNKDKRSRLRPRRMLGRTQCRIRALLLYVNATEDAVLWRRKVYVSYVYDAQGGLLTRSNL